MKLSFYKISIILQIWVLWKFLPWETFTEKFYKIKRISHPKVINNHMRSVSCNTNYGVTTIFKIINLVRLKNLLDKKQYVYGHL